MIRTRTSPIRRAVRLASAGALAVAVLIPGVTGPEAARASEPVVVAPDGCTSGTLTVQRGVVGYEHWNVEELFTHVELLMNPVSPKFPGQIRYTVVTFATSGNETAECTWNVPDGVTRGQLLVVGGGGAGGTTFGGGGGGGGVYYGKVPVTTTLGAVFDPGAELRVTVGAGGAAAAAGCVGAACAGSQGGASSVSVGGSVVVSAGGGGGGGGDRQSAPTVGGDLPTAGGGGGGAAMTDDGQSLAEGVAGQDASEVNSAYRDEPGGLLGGPGGIGAAGSASGTVRISGGGGGAKARHAQFGTGVGAGGVGITFSRGAVHYGAGGGGLQRGVSGCLDCFSYYSQPSGSPSSGGAGGTAGSGGAGSDGTGGGGGGGGASGQGGRGGAGIIMIAFPDPMEVTGPQVVSATYGTALSSDLYSFTNGNNTLDTAYRVRSAANPGLADPPPTGLAMSLRRIHVGATAAAGIYDLVVIATSAIDTVATRAVTLTIARASQSPVTFVSDAPVEAAVGDAGDGPTFAGGSGTGAYVLTSADEAVCGVTFLSGAWRVAHISEGECELSVEREEDANHLASEPTTRSYSITAAVAVEDPVEGSEEGSDDGSDDGSGEGSTDEPIEAPEQSPEEGSKDQPSEGPAEESFGDTGEEALGEVHEEVVEVPGPGEAAALPVVEERDEGAPGDAPTAGRAGTPSVDCSPGLPWAGGQVGCMLSGGMPSETVSWRASYNPTFASGTTTLDDAGRGTFAFVVPTAALGAPLVIEIVGWGEPMMLAAELAGPVPVSIPSGEGPSATGTRSGTLPAALAVLLLALLLHGGALGRSWWLRGDPGGSRG